MIESSAKILCVIAARGGSQGVPGKNIRSLLGKPVIAWAIEKALQVPRINHVVVSTDSNEIAEIAQRAGATVPFIRPQDLAQSSTGKFQVWQHALAACEVHFQLHYDVFIDLDCTNPLIDVADIERSIDQFFDSQERGVEAIFTVAPARRNPYFNLVEYDSSGALKMSKRQVDTVLSRQNAPKVYEHVAGAYVMAAHYLKQANHLLDGHAEGYEVDEEKSFDIDSETDFLIVEMLLRRQLETQDESLINVGEAT